MTTRRATVAVSCAALLGLASESAGAAPALRVQVDQRGDFVLIGNTLGQDCAPAVPLPLVGTIGNCGTIGLTDTAPDVFWRSDAPGAGLAQANNAIPASQARSTSMLVVPPGATITHAYLYWGARLPAAGSDPTVTFDRQGGFSATVNATQSYQLAIPQGGGVTANFYQSVADVTSLVQANGPGAYRVGGVESSPLVDVNASVNFAGWWMAVFYALPTDPPRDLALFDGLDVVSPATFQTAALTGFIVPNAGFDAKLAVAAYEGDSAAVGDELFFGDLVTPLSDPANPANNFFNSTRSLLGGPVHNAGDLPELTGGSGSMSGLDLDVVDIKSKLVAGQTSAPIKANSTGDVYYLAGFVTSISTIGPDFATAAKSAADGNGGALLVGDTIDYAIVVPNSGNDASINTVLTDPLPAGVTYVPGSLKVTAGANAGAKTDAAGDDQGEYDAATRTITVRLGAGADALSGGTLLVGASTTVAFKVTVDAGVSGSIENQATITAAGQQGAPTKDTVTDGNGAAPGSPPTTVIVDACVSNAGCSAPTPVCFTTPDPNVCVQCVVDADCLGAAAACDPVQHTCSCMPTGAEVCDGVDNDCNGIADEGNPGGGADCATGLPGACAAGVLACGPGGSLACQPTIAPGSQVETCNGADDDCDGVADDGFDLGAACTTGAGACANAGVVQCNGAGGAACSAAPGLPSPEICDGIDNDCDGIADDGSPGANQACTTAFPGICAAGQTACVGGSIQCIATVLPGQQQETCGDALDSDCDGNVDDDCADTDGDGLPDFIELEIGTDPNDADSDDDGVKDGDEPSFDVDSDGDGLINALDPDSDDDGLFDGTEVGSDCSSPATDAGAGHCVADADAGATTTDPLDADTDDGGVSDGDEDEDHDGQIDAGERDPNDVTDDGCTVDAECGNETSGKVCDDATHACIDGCRGTGGNGCPSDLECTSTDATIGQCIPIPDCTVDLDCGAATSGKVCDEATHECIDGCRGTNGNGCPSDQTCTSTDNSIGQCIQVPECEADSDCGAATSGRICEGSICIDGCRGAGGNGCAPGALCSSTTDAAGTCSQPPALADGAYPEGNGIFCATRPGDRDAAPFGWIVALVLSGGLAARRRRRRA